jgi:hypothetical protein
LESQESPCDLDFPAENNLAKSETTIAGCLMVNLAAAVVGSRKIC